MFDPTPASGATRAQGVRAAVGAVGAVGASESTEPTGHTGLDVARWKVLLEALAHEVARDDDGAARTDPGTAAAAACELIADLESLRNAAAAAQAALAVRLDRCRRSEEAAQGVPAKHRGRGVAAEVALARRVGVSGGSRLLGLGKVLRAEMPHTFARLAAGELSEWRATLLARETACLDLEDRVAVDAELCADPRTLAGLGDRSVVARAKQAGYRRDAVSVVRRAKVAEGDRRVWLRPAPDQMAYLTALLPLTQAVASYAALKTAANTVRATGEGVARSHGQVMADTLVTRVTGLADPAAVPIRVNLVMTDTAFFSGDREPGVVPGFGLVPAGWARGQVGRAGAAAWVRRLYVSPRSGDLVAMDSRSRAVPQGLADFVALRDQGTCRMPWCDAPLRHLDHVVAVENGGQTTEANLQSLCEQHNYAKQAPGWQMQPRPSVVDGLEELRQIPAGSATGTRRVVRSGPHETVVRTPSGRTYLGRAPRPPQRARRVRDTPQGPAP